MDGHRWLRVRDDRCIRHAPSPAVQAAQAVLPDVLASLPADLVLRLARAPVSALVRAALLALCLVPERHRRACVRLRVLASVAAVSATRR